MAMLFAQLILLLIWICVTGAVIAVWKEETEMLQIFWTCITVLLAYYVVLDISVRGLLLMDIFPIFLVVYFAVFLYRISNEPRVG
jgi:hypothetical protein